MKTAIYHVNETGLNEIKAFLTANVKDVGHITKDMLGAWAADAENSLSESGAATIELPARASVTGCPMCYTISNAGLDFEKIEIDE